MPPLQGAIEYRSRRSEPVTLRLLQTYVPNEGPAWQMTLDELSRYFERVLALPGSPNLVAAIAGSVVDLAAEQIPAAVAELLDGYLEWAWLLGQRTAERHLALACCGRDSAFAPELFGTLYQRSL